MTVDDLTALLASYPGATSGYPFGPDVEVWKVGGKMFALVAVDADPLRVSLKCDPDLALELRAQYPDQVAAGYHLDKRHWNTVTVDATLPPFELEDWVGHSYHLVVAGLAKKVREALG